MKNKYVPFGASVAESASIVIDFQYYKDSKCEIKKFLKAGEVRKILKFIMEVGKCMDNDELHEYLKGSNVQDMSDDSYYQSLSPSKEMKIYEVWHDRHVAERIFFTRAGNVFYPVVFLYSH